MAIVETESPSCPPTSSRWSLPGLFKSLGPGIITGAADDDPSGIATYSQAGAQQGFGLLWTVVLTLPLMVAVQSVSARIGRVTGHGLAANMVRVFPRSVVTLLVGLLFVANTINLGADLAAMGAGAKLMSRPWDRSSQAVQRCERAAAGSDPGAVGLGAGSRPTGGWRLGSTPFGTVPRRGSGCRQPQERSLASPVATR